MLCAWHVQIVIYNILLEMEQNKPLVYIRPVIKEYNNFNLPAEKE